MPLLRQFSLVPPSAVVLKFIIKIWVEGGYKCNNLYTSTMIKITFILGFGNIKLAESNSENWGSGTIQFLGPCKGNV